MLTKTGSFPATQKHVYLNTQQIFCHFTVHQCNVNQSHTHTTLLPASAISALSRVYNFTGEHGDDVIVPGEHGDAW